MAEIGAFSHPTIGDHPQTPPPTYDLSMAGASGKKIKIIVMCRENRKVLFKFFLVDFSIQGNF